MDLSSITNLLEIALISLSVLVIAALLFINLYPYLFYKAPIIKSALDKFDTIIVLGYPATKEGKPSPIMRERVAKAVELFNSGYARNIICSGSNNKSKYVEAEVMKQYAISLGVPENCLIKEDKSLNTYRNIVNSIEVMKDKNWSTAIVVTSPWHIRRASYLLSKFHIIYLMKKTDYPKEYSIFYITLIYMFENYIMTRNKILFH
jgi:uncharacterized SAM-binding protein YcdF (DUF218 family)